ncbi:hypothetical protein DDB_G0292598 [Dictyostelium discoideum AX4]|uniref:UPF0519 protein C n=1 Tax=Dictyostelium discoideum TaxID=44689 RepID=U519C_DICDI|nr:hypothetical protein DDB_G0292598 [Dictyostelium discoideum AX4]Q54D05.2 RecName: Full=UPF0519 protein C [Dictyostelium discoideum]EAL61102.2 hypothetical protein DDB_G0292598 [Dictyostelium discoideum AX4]|eukprot:XP_629515.2 hypothetical protein DDB_G0292598 [Dictyostelium discoideum AX4]
MTIINSISSLGKISNKNKSQANLNSNSTNSPNNVQGLNQNTGLVSSLLELVRGVTFALGLAVESVGL